MDRGVSKDAILGVIGGSGVYRMDGVEVVGEEALETPFGSPSDAIVEARIGERPVFFLPRHGRGHRLLPSEVNSRGNIHALKQLQVTHVLAVSAVGIMQGHIHPGEMVVPDQIFDRTKGVRPSTFFGDGIVGHLAFADPFCEQLRQIVLQGVAEQGVRVHDGGTYLCMEGPQFSTRAESHFYRRETGAAIIGMTALPEAKLAREAEMCYAMLALGTDYDCWHEEEEDVSIEAVLEILRANVEAANGIVQKVAGLMPAISHCDCLQAAKNAIITAPEMISDEVKERLGVLYGQYFERK